MTDLHGLDDLQETDLGGLADLGGDVVDVSGLDELDDEEAQPGEPGLVYGSVDEFVRDWLRYVYRRPVGYQLRWAANWWAYDEAVNRLTSMWRAWETLRRDPGIGLSSWFRDHGDYHMGILLSPDGPFAGLTGEEHRNNRGDPLPCTPPPPGMFGDERVNLARLPPVPDPSSVPPRY